MSNLSSKAYVALVDALIATRKELGVTQEDLAGRLGKTQSFVSKSERRQRRIDFVEFIAIAEALGLDAPDFLRSLRQASPGRIFI